MYPFRVFVSYAHEDEKLAADVAAFLDGLGLINMWDRSIDPGKPFAEEIKTRIGCSHLFMPLITENSLNRPWVHQETGYAMGMEVPVLPIAVAGQVPDQMIRELQAVRVGPALEGLSEQITEMRLERAVLPPEKPPAPTFISADHPERRAELIAQFAGRVRQLSKGGRCGRIRHRGAFSSFCIPNKPPDHPIWKQREGKVTRSRYYHKLQWEERKELEKHARECGCDLILDPNKRLPENGEEARRVRLDILLEFLKRKEFLKRTKDDGNDVCVVTRRRTEPGNLIIVGDWFTAESVTRRDGVGYVQTNFTWHAPFVLYTIRNFDDVFEQFDREWRDKKRNKKGDKDEDKDKSSLTLGIEEIEETIASIEV